jgi:polyisoprenoid-binding protein YceI
MKRNHTLGALVFALALVAPTSQAATAKNYILDSTHSSANFKVKHLMSKTAGTFKDFTGTFTFDGKDAKSFKGSFTVKADSIFTNEPKRDDHLKSPDFFDVAKFPTLTFSTTSIKTAGKDKFKMTGDLAIHGITKAVTFDGEFLGTGKDPWGNEKAGFTATTKINRKDFGLTWNKVLEAGGLLVGEEVEIEIQIEGNVQK